MNDWDWVLAAVFWLGMILSVPASEHLAEPTLWVMIVVAWFAVASYLGTVLIIRLARVFIHDVTSPR